MKVLFEDNRRHSPMSELCDLLYGKENTRYSMGNGNLLYVISDLLDKCISEEIIVYVDVTPDNPKTLRVFKMLQEHFKDYKNVYIIPILCSEHCILLTLESIGFPLGNCIVDIIHAKISYKKTKYGKEKNIEHAMKAILFDLKDKIGSLYCIKKVKLNNRVFSPEKRATEYILSHKGVLSTDTIEDNCDYPLIETTAEFVQNVYFCIYKEFEQVLQESKG